MDEIYDYISKSKVPLSVSKITSHFSNKLTESKLKISLTNLISQKRVETFTDPINNETFFKILREQNEDEINSILSLLSENHNGLTSRQIRLKLNMSANLITKVLKKMEMTDKIKSYKGVKGNVKIYTIFLTEGDDLGIFFNEGNVDVELVEGVMKVILKLFSSLQSDKNSADDNTNNGNKMKGVLSVDEIHKLIINSGVLQVSIQKKDVQKILKVMFYDNLILEVNTGSELLYLSK
ncbi:putative DNA-directed RNA polymerase III subunit RPC6 [Cucumispora dikerogammari]|nr:putative DNA-directed RNA polymerase III subunit RPC6 [Cucumispora dikerogammari]